ncbi:AMP-binding protein [Zavarzinia compransoris]|uniref:AMP-dependent synthetase n=1 Tax=Zavarzinia compransoris TaxID=1264899 RepID=A0A317E3B1_9PROT|nr:AMP-binding protein [Zavarzinia compransoris]PWR21082.1 AMP-dependent synthetase [Zavarzinia compransoris]TDP43997.1 acetyl-CoA synthetase [Zavarzinia compransoris]
MAIDPSPSFAEARDFLLRHRTDYDTAVAGFRWPRPAQFNWALDWFDGVLATAPDSRDRAALRIHDPEGSEISVSFGQMAAASNRVANFLRAQGVRRGERILLLLGNVVPLWECMLAAIKLGAVIIPATTLLTPEDLADRLARGRVRHIVTDPAQVEKFAGLPGIEAVGKIVTGAAVPGWAGLAAAHGGDYADTFAPGEATAATDPMLLYFTSGTTAKPKLVVHSHQSYPLGALSTMYWLGLQPGDLHLNISSPGWAKHAWSSFFAPWNAGATVFIVSQARFNAAQLLDVLATTGVTTLCAPPTVWRMLIQQDMGRWRTGLRELCSAGEPLNPEVIEHVERVWGLTIRDGYGQTETTAQIGNPPGQKLKLGSMGRSLPGYGHVLLDPDGAVAAEGEVCLPLSGAGRPAGLMLGYEVEGRMTATDGEVYRTGDVAERDAEGYLTFVGRADDVFKASDYRISPFELESILIEHEAVAEAAVVPSPDPLRLAVPKAFVILAAGHAPDGATARAIFAHLRGRLAPYKRVRRLEFVEDLPKTISGKIRRVDLRRAEEKRGDEPGPREFAEHMFPDLA